MIPGEVRVSDIPLEGRPDAQRFTVVMVNDGDRPIQIGSHLHLPAANPALRFDREATDGFRLDIPSGTSVRFEPGVSRSVTVVRFGGRRVIPGLQVTRTEPETSGAVPVVPFGTPGSHVEAPAHPLGVTTRMAETDETDETHETEDAR